MAGTIKINNPIVGGVIMLIALFLIWVVAGPFGLGSQSLVGYIWPSIMTLVVAYVYYNSFWGKKK